jgi:hypothetical protein
MMLRADNICNVLFVYFLNYSPANHFPFIATDSCLFPEISLGIFQTLCPVNVEVISCRRRSFSTCRVNAALFEYKMANGAEFYCR